MHKEKEGNKDKIGFCRIWLFFFFSQHSPPQAVTRLSEDNCNIYLVVYIENICFPFGMYLNYMEKIKEKKKQEGQITIIRILKFVCSEGFRGGSTFIPLLSIVLASVLRRLPEQCFPLGAVRMSTCKNVRGRLGILTSSWWHAKGSSLIHVLQVCWQW